jgi:septum formation protein
LNDKVVRLEQLVLASSSPRRAEILNAVGWSFKTMAANVDETRAESEDAVTYVKRLALRKAMAVAKRVSSGLVLGADTVVVVDDEILGQPRDREDARRMLMLLRGKWHEVFTGVALVRLAEASRFLVEYEVTRVRFCEISEEEIEWYVATGEPMEKAGGYAIQGKGALFIQEIEGDYFNIVGLPVRLVCALSQRI